MIFPDESVMFIFVFPRVNVAEVPASVALLIVTVAVACETVADCTGCGETTKLTLHVGGGGGGVGVGVGTGVGVGVGVGAGVGILLPQHRWLGGHEPLDTYRPSAAQLGTPGIQKPEHV